ncbi:MFS transporter [Shewanella surugensis]|uniref:MFS transporter n=1 Tax=Shewanella surugensis TaxID=212020 RepID=A0ABT0LC17_9GAMM|nr:MFS transporter [Shewanella surugensis]MCL1125228.1 MFS transporter [Shewanella surugensis]
MTVRLNTHQRVLFLCSLGGLLEFYDFIISALLASYIASIFFPTETEINGLLAAFATFAVGYLARPLGGIIFGHFGDVYGRKRTFTFSILMMALATFCIGLIPNYTTLGITAPILLIFFKIIQGISIGGEIPGAITYISEFFPKKKGLATGVVFCFLISGISMGYLVQASLISLYTDEQITAWAWRLPFFLGGIFGIIAFYLRKKLIEIPQFIPYLDPNQPFPILEVLNKQWRVFILTTIITGLGAIVIVSLFTFLPAYLTKILHYTLNDMIWMSASAVFIAALSCILFGWLSDKVRRINLLLLLIVAVFILATPIFYIYTEHFLLYPLSLALSALLVGLSWGNIPAILSESFPSNIRYSGIGLSYNVGFGIVGGLTPLILISSIKWSESTMAPAYVLMLASVLSLLTLVCFKKNLSMFSDKGV